MLRYHRIDRGHWAGGLVILIGVAAAAIGWSYDVGSLSKMGPGFFPVVLGIVLAGFGICILATTVISMHRDEEGVLPAEPQWIGWLCVLGGPISFIVLGYYSGMIPAIFSCVFVSAFGDRTATTSSSIGLAAIMTIFGVLLFSYGLKVPFPLLGRY